MSYYDSTAYIYSQGFQKLLICYCTIFLRFIMIFQSFSHKRKTTLNRGPRTSTKINSSEPVLLATIHMSHDSAENPFAFFEFERDVLHASWNRGCTGARQRGSSVVEKGRPGYAAMRRARTRSQHGPRWPMAYWPQKQAATVAAATDGRASWRRRKAR